jgi:hypothetical protein
MALNPGRATNEPLNYFAFGVQSAINVDATVFYFTKHLSGSGFETQSDFKAERVGGAGREIGLIYKNMVKADGSLITYAWPDGAARLLTIALGTDASQSYLASPGNGAPSQYLSKHYIWSGGATLPYLTMDQTWADESERTTNCQLTELKIEGESGLPIKLTAPFISGGTPHQATVALAPVREGGQPLMFPNASAALEVFSEGTGALGKGSTSELTKFNIDVKNALDESIQTLALNRTDVVWETVDFNLDGTVKYTDKNIWNQVNYQGGSQVQVNLATGNFTFFTRSPSDASMCLLIKVPIAVFGDVKVNRLDPDGKTMMMDFTALTQGGPTAALYVEATTRATASYTLSTT